MFTKISELIKLGELTKEELNVMNNRAYANLELDFNEWLTLGMMIEDMKVGE